MSKGKIVLGVYLNDGHIKEFESEAGGEEDE